MKKRNLGSLLKNRIRSYSARAAAASIGIHLLLIIFAGSIVAVHYVKKQNSGLIARTESRPRLERKKLQAPAKVEQLQKRALTSKLVSKKVSFSNPDFVLPDTGKISSLKTQKSMLPGIDAGRVLKNLSRTPGVGPSQISFFGVRAEGEKAVLMIDASGLMLEDRTGGPATYEYIKTELAKIVSEMPPAMLFNLVFYDRNHVFMFRPNLIPAVHGTAGELTEWMSAVNEDPEHPGLTGGQDNYSPPAVYDTAIDSDSHGWVRALQASMEQQPDVILALGSGWGTHRISKEKAARLLDYAMWELMAGNLISGAPALEPDRKLRADLLKEASEALKKEDKQRDEKDLPPGFVRDISQYVEYSKDQILDHLNAVAQAAYADQGLSLPVVDYVCLSESDNQVVTGDVVKDLRFLTGQYNGRLDFLRRESNRSEVAEKDSLLPDDSGKPVKATVPFFGAEERGSRIAFILEASEEMIAKETGGTFSYEVLKELLLKAVSEIQSGVPFNVILYDGTQAVLFRSEMVSADAERLAALKEWLLPVNNDPLRPGIPDGYSNTVKAVDYGTVIGSDVAGWPLALQTAIEQRADWVWIAASGWGKFVMNRERGRKLLDFSIWDAWGSGGGSSGSGGVGGSTIESTVDNVVETVDESGEVTLSTESTTTSETVAGSPASSGGSASLGNISGMEQDKQQRNALFREALKAIEQENQDRKSKKLPPPFVRDILDYLRYTPAQIREHLDEVIRVNDPSGGEQKPALHFICLQPAEGRPDADTVRNLRNLTTGCNGSYILLRGAESRSEMKHLNRDIDWSE
jgi:hypothetical protein